jgi:DNA-binding NtrC family response regulator
MRILLVEDSDDVRFVTVELLAELGHRVIAVSDAEQALAQLSAAPLAAERFDAVMTDVSLPGISGIALAKEIVRLYPEMPVIISSGYGALDLKFLFGQQTRRVFALPKPYDLIALDAALKLAAKPAAEA